MDKRLFWTTKPRRPEFHAVVFTHPAFLQPIRLVANVFEVVRLGGFEHAPAPMQIDPPQISSEGQPKLRLSFPRKAVGRRFKQELARVTASGLREPITVVYSVYLDDTAAPQVSWTLYAADSGGVTFGADTVQLLATLDNPMRRSVAPIYDPQVFTGLRFSS